MLKSCIQAHCLVTPFQILYANNLIEMYSTTTLPPFQKKIKFCATKTPWRLLFYLIMVFEDPLQASTIGRY